MGKNGPRSDWLEKVSWALIFFWAALVLLIEAQNVTLYVSWWHTRSIFFIGTGIIVLLGTTIRLSFPAYRRGILEGYIFGLILLGLGFSIWNWVIPLILLGIDVTLLLRVYNR